jgi:hypothetical protein
MKKVVMVAAAVLVGVAFAGSLNVPFFLDNGGGGLPPATGTAGFIGVHNNTGADILANVQYISSTGVALPTVSGSNTFLIPANGSVSWRPVADDSTTEGPQGAAVPNMDPGALPKAGSAVISWPNPGAQDVQGRYVEFTSTGSSNAYLLPPGL